MISLFTNGLLGQVPDQIEIPLFESNDTIVKHSGYSVSYSHTFRQANWVAYQLTKLETVKLFDRSDKFIADPLIMGTDNEKDYVGSGYDRGHLAPAADLSYSKITMDESFYYSNMSPQLPGFNRGVWKRLEDLTRDWAVEYDSLYIIVGPVLQDSLKTIGEHKIAVPNYYYKVILDYHTSEMKMIGFLFKNESSSESLQKFALPIDSVELITGIDFFPILSDEVEKKLESSVCLTCWNWGVIPKKTDINKKSKKDR